MVGRLELLGLSKSDLCDPEYILYNRFRLIGSHRSEDILPRLSREPF